MDQLVFGVAEVRDDSVHFHFGLLLRAHLLTSLFSLGLGERLEGESEGLVSLAAPRFYDLCLFHFPERNGEQLSFFKSVGLTATRKLASEIFL